MKILQTNYENLVFYAGQPVIDRGISHWDIEHDGNWLIVCSANKTGLFKVESVLGTFTRAINEEIAFINYFQNKYTKTFTSS